MSVTGVLRPTGNGTTIELSHTSGSNYQCVDDETDSEYVYNNAGAYYLTDVYTFDFSSVPSNAIIEKIKVTSQYQNRYGGSGLLARVSFYCNGSVGTGITETTVTDVMTVVEEFTTNPMIGSPWARTALDYLQIGAGLKSNSDGYDILLLWIKCEVYYHLPDSLIVTLYPSGNSTPLQLTPSSGSNYQCVDDEIDMATCDIFHQTSYLRDMYTLPDSQVPSNAIIDKIIVSQFTNGYNGYARNVIKSSSTTVTGTETSTTNGALITTELTTDPNTSAAWTLSAIDALIIGADVKNVEYEYSYLHWIKCEVYYHLVCIAARGCVIGVC